MNQIITNVRYIQRLNVPKPHLNKGNPFSFGCGLKNGGMSDAVMEQMSEIVTFDYMGSAEYETGKLRATFFQMFESHAQDPLRLKKIKVLEKDVWVLTNTSLMTEAVAVVKKLGTTKKMEWKLKRPSLFPSVLKEANCPIPTAGWIDIENNYMFFVNEEIAQKFLKLLTE
jgi:hypothetical protein